MKETVRNLSVRLDREEKETIVDPEENQPKQGGGVDFYPHWGHQQGVRRGEREGELHHGERGEDRSQVCSRKNKDRREKEKQKQEEENKTGEEEEELYMPEGEDGRPSIKWRKKKAVSIRKAKIETVEKKMEESEELYMSKKDCSFNNGVSQQNLHCALFLAGHRMLPIPSIFKSAKTMGRDQVDNTCIEI